MHVNTMSLLDYQSKNAETYSKEEQKAKGNCLRSNTPKSSIKMNKSLLILRRRKLMPQ